MQSGRRVTDGDAGGAPVTVYLARRIARERKMSGGVTPSRLPVAPEVFAVLVEWMRLKSGFGSLVGWASRANVEQEEETVLFDGVEVFPSERARAPWRVRLETPLGL